MTDIDKLIERLRAEAYARAEHCDSALIFDETVTVDIFAAADALTEMQAENAKLAKDYVDARAREGYLEAENARLREALVEITKYEGSYSARIARRALEDNDD